MTPKHESPRSEDVQYATGEERRRITFIPRMNESVVDVSGDESNIRCYKEQYCIGTWNVRSINQGKLDMVKQAMVRINISILGISELRWTGIGKFNSDDHCIYYCRLESHRRNGVAIIVNKKA